MGLTMIECSICNKPKFRNDLSYDCSDCVKNLKQQVEILKSCVEYVGKNYDLYCNPVIRETLEKIKELESKLE